MFGALYVYISTGSPCWSCPHQRFIVCLKNRNVILKKTYKWITSECRPKKNSWRLTQNERLQFQGLTRVILLCNQRCIEKKTASDQIRISSENKVVKFKVLQPDLINIFLATQFLFHYILYYFLLSKSLQSLAFHLLQRNLEQLFLC